MRSSVRRPALTSNVRSADKSAPKKLACQVSCFLRYSFFRPCLGEAYSGACLNVAVGTSTGQLPIIPVVSMGHCNTGLESTLRSFKAQRLSRALI